MPWSPRAVILFTKTFIYTLFKPFCYMHYFLIHALLTFWFNIFWLAVHYNAADSVRNVWHRTRLRHSALTVNFLSHCAPTVLFTVLFYGMSVYQHLMVLAFILTLWERNINLDSKGKPEFKKEPQGLSTEWQLDAINWTKRKRIANICRALCLAKATECMN